MTPADRANTDDRAFRARERLLASLAIEVTDQRVLATMRAVSRERFVKPGDESYAYEDEPLSIGYGQTISQPFIVAIMTAALALDGTERVLEIGTGSGYQCAILARLAREVVSVEVVPELRARAERVLRDLGCTNVTILPAGDAPGAPERAPFDAIIVTAAAPAIPPSLVAQLADRGRMVIPVGTRAEQDLLLVTRTSTGIEQRSLGGCRFVPLVGPEGFDARPNEH
ncbi:MAG: protein-L-isoaspartate(D-aspartate) O-methyltransferase [Dehalococcoidia bacterium]|nr:protein-L-isoaspartate(D-aspartate) O-methyltransferase [Dehalococcoidia bacterium]